MARGTAQAQALWALGAAALGLAIAVVAALVHAIDWDEGPGLLAGVAAIGLVLAAVVLWHAVAVLRRHFTALERLRGAVLALAGNSDARLPVLKEGETGLEIRRLHEALAQLNARAAEQAAAPDQRLQAVLASIEEAMVVVTEQGQISLVNHAAKALLGADRVAVGTSVYAALSRASMQQAIGQARDAGRPVDAMIGTLEDHQLTAKVAVLAQHGGAVLTFPAGEVAFRAELDCDFDLHDQPPPTGPVTGDTPLASLAVLALDTETTGLDVNADRVVSIGAVRMLGERMYRSTSFDRLVNPGVPIPPRSTAIHGITDAMVADALPFAEVFAALQPHLSGTVVVGHHITFDLRVLAQECTRAGRAWTELPFLDTLLLAAALDPRLEELSLDSLAGSLGVTVHGRHTALGDSLVAGEVFARLLPRLHDRGVATLDDARTFSKRARSILRAQQKAGW